MWGMSKKQQSIAEVNAQFQTATSCAIELGEWDNIPTVVSAHYVTLADTMRDLAIAVATGNVGPYLLTLGAD